MHVSMYVVIILDIHLCLHILVCVFVATILEVPNALDVIFSASVTGKHKTFNFSIESISSCLRDSICCCSIRRKKKCQN